MRRIHRVKLARPCSSWQTSCLNGSNDRLTTPRDTSENHRVLTVHFWVAYNLIHRGCSSVVERLLPKQDIVGSSPITRSSWQTGCTCVEERLTSTFLFVIL